ncbi:hydrogenase formation protein HypD [uncultured Tolumonas sp.]|uniref:hydrogenase formation protein HypD n=1 Tax=uncultured Tolumonas sp. TaxID=263765 RepID=UPI00292E479D|nr:hydrogenase formation protein HypD [uncultured Tolumonas sp.]
MKFLDEYRDGAAARRFVEAIRREVTRPWSLMEVCGGQTHSIVRFGLDELLPPEINLIHGPGCPVCVTPVELIDKAVAIAQRPEVIFCSFGDMLRVPGTASDLFGVKSRGGDVRIVYSPLDCLKIAEENSGRQVVFFAVGFETTAPANAMSVFEARRRGLENYSILVSHVLVPPALEAVLASPQRRVDGFIAAGHVCSIMGTAEYVPLAEKHKVPIVVAGFEPVDLLQAIHMLVRQLEAGRHEVENQYERVVRAEGNRPAQELIQSVFEVRDRAWRGIGVIPQSGWGLRPEYAAFDAELRFQVEGVGGPESTECQSGLVLQGIIKPHQCPAFGTRCTPDNPLGATMVSNEGACAAYYRYRRHEK